MFLSCASPAEVDVAGGCRDGEEVGWGWGCGLGHAGGTRWRKTDLPKSDREPSAVDQPRLPKHRCSRGSSERRKTRRPAPAGIHGSSVKHCFTVPSRLRLDLQGHHNAYAVGLSWKGLMGLIRAGLIPLPSFSPFWLDKNAHGGEKKSMSQQVSPSSKRWRCSEFTTFSAFHSVLRLLGPGNWGLRLPSGLVLSNQD